MSYVCIIKHKEILMRLKIEVLGMDCSKCNTLFLRVNKVVSEHSIDAEVTKIEYVQEIATQHILQFPALLVNGDLVSKGTVPSERKIIDLINNFLSDDAKIHLPAEQKKSKNIFFIAALAVLIVALVFILKNYQSNPSTSPQSDSTITVKNQPKEYKDWVNKLYNYSQQSTSYKITFLEFGSTNCRECKNMEKVMVDVKENFKNKVNVVFYNVRKKENKKMVDFFKINIIPVQVLLDSNGVEYFRHEGFLNYTDLITHFK